MHEIFIIPALNDNYIFLIRDHNSNVTAVVDPGEAKGVVEFLKTKDWSLDYILNTHHHLDHVQGNLILKAQTGCQIIGAQIDSRRIPGIDIQLKENDLVKIGDIELKVLDMTGHTTGHIAYYSEVLQALFSGDVLFGLGCGRVFEGTLEQMFKAIQKIKKLPSSTKVYCSHEYAEKNIDFALQVDRENLILRARISEIQAARAKHFYTVPLNLNIELQTNPFLRTQMIDLQKSHNCSNELELFSYFRNYRDQM